MPAKIDKTGKTYGSLEVISYAGKYVHGGAQWLCRCNICGSEKVFRGQSIGKNKTCSLKCGVSLSNIHRTKHGHSKRGSPTGKVHNSWSGIKQRCYNPKHSHYHRYGGRGITMFSEWVNDYLAFYNYIGDAPDTNQRWSIDRIDNNGNYEPDNIRWALPNTQANNKSVNVNLTFNGETKNLEQWAKHLGISSSSLSKKRNRGDSIEDILKPSSNRRGEKVLYGGREVSLMELSKLTGIKYGTLWGRRLKGYPLLESIRIRINRAVIRA